MRLVKAATYVGSGRKVWHNTALNICVHLLLQCNASGPIFLESQRRPCVPLRILESSRKPR